MRETIIHVPIEEVELEPLVEEQPELPPAPVITTTQAEWLYTLRMCESTNSYTRNTGNSFYGAYQFMIPTWNSIATYKVDGYVSRPDLIGVRPDLASPADQDYMILKNTTGTAGLVSQNPGCYAKTGLSNRPPN